MKNALLLIMVAGLLLAALPMSAHTVNYTLEGASAGYVFWYYFKLGFEHILPLGLDHILFVVSLFLLSPKVKDMLWQATAFTVAHTVTLILTMKGTLTAPADIVEPIIAFSIALVALENIYSNRLSKWRIGIVFAFGLIHGMGFAGALNGYGLPRDAFYYSLITFNVGVEVGQLAVILGCWLAFGAWFSRRTWYRQRIVYPLSAGIALLAVWWTFERIFLV